MIIDSSFVREFLTADGVSGVKSIDKIVDDVQNFEANAIASYQGPKPSPQAATNAGGLTQKASVGKSGGKHK